MNSGTLFDVAGILALLVAVGGVIAWAFQNYSGNDVARQRALFDRDNQLDARRAEELKQIRADLDALKRSSSVMIGLVHVMVDELFELDPKNTTLFAISHQLHEAYPITADMPAELLNLLVRIDSRITRGQPQ